MRRNAIISGMSVAVVCLAGCQTQPPSPLAKPAPVIVEKKPEPPPTPMSRKRTPEQMQLLQNFAQKESPKIWQTIQVLRGEMSESGRRIKQLRADLLEFDRNPDSDEDYKALVAGFQELKHAYNAIFDKLEDAYIAAKKYEASPSRKDYQDTMKRALEDGINDANMATERYRAMARQK